MLLSTVLFILVITVLCLAVVYYWSFIHFSHLFEDRVIDEYTFQKNQDMGVKNEWILGVTTDSIDVVESIHKETVAQRIQEQAEKQTEPEKLYRETIDGKHLLYSIRLDTENGETLYRYSIIKDIYAETFPQIAAFLLLFVLVIAGISVLYSNTLSRDLYSGIRRLRGYSRRIAQGKPTSPIDIHTCDEEFRALAEDLEVMRKAIETNNESRQNALQYISHEMKTPIMVIEGYATSAIDGFYPKGTLEDSLETILFQTERMKQRVQDLLTIVRVDALSTPEDLTDVPVLPCIQETIGLLKKSLMDKQWQVDVREDLILRGSREHIMILLENLITNQIKYCQSSLSITQEETPDHHILRFYNDGPPVPQSMRDTLFKPFVKGSAEGSGLGLAICRGIVAQMGGDIHLEDTQEGTCFLLEFPKT